MELPRYEKKTRNMNRSMWRRNFPGLSAVCNSTVLFLPLQQKHQKGVEVIQSPWRSAVLYRISSSAALHRDNRANSFVVFFFLLVRGWRSFRVCLFKRQGNKETRRQGDKGTRGQVDKETRRRDIVTVRVWGRGESHAFDTYRDLSLDSKHLRGFRVWYNTERSSLSWRRRQTRSYMKLDRITHARPNRSHTPHIQEANRCIRWFTFAHAELRSHSIQTKNWYEDTNICFSMWSPKNREQ